MLWGYMSLSAYTNIIKNDTLVPFYRKKLFGPIQKVHISLHIDFNHMDKLVKKKKIVICGTVNLSVSLWSEAASKCIPQYL